MDTQPIIHSSSDVFAWISRFINLEKGQSRNSFRLDRMITLAELAGHPETCAPAIHIAGSKGKGSVTGMISCILEAAGMKTARYTSPDLGDRRERITCGSNFFDENIYIDAGKELVETEKALFRPGAKTRKLFSPADEGGEEPTFFELMTLYFFLCARRAACDIMVIETGMGGRLDATNIVSPLLSVITLIELEHTEYLGDTLRKIASEKAGIIKTKKKVILSKQEPEALEVFSRISMEREAPLVYAPDMVNIQNFEISKTGTSGTLNFRGPLKSSLQALNIHVPIPGKVQIQNAALAVLSVKTAFPEIDPRIIQQGLADFTLPARFERIQEKPPFIVDGAHTAHSSRLCAETFTGLYGFRGLLLFGCAEGKDINAMAEILAPCFSYIIITTPGTFKKSDPLKIYESFSSVSAANRNLFFIPDTQAAINKALELGEQKELPILGIGSFYLAAEIRNMFGKK
jgi:dihydrofolate synthase/folylpolyglutamate synthase